MMIYLPSHTITGEDETDGPRPGGKVVLGTKQPCSRNIGEHDINFPEIWKQLCSRTVDERFRGVPEGFQRPRKGVWTFPYDRDLPLDLCMVDFSR